MKTRILAVTLAMAFGVTGHLIADTETVGGYTWTYSINSYDGDTATIYNNNSAAISPAPTGAVTIPATLGGKTVTGIGDMAFYECTGLTGVTIPDSVTHIGDAVFGNCSRLASLTMPDSVTSIGEYAFSHCSGLTSVMIPDSVTSIEYGAFDNSSGLTNMVFNGNAPSLGFQVFNGISPDCICYVSYSSSSTGWGVEIPGKWHGLRIEYLPREVTDAMVGTVADVTYTGAAHKPEPVVTVPASGVTLVKGTDYTLSWGENTNAGSGSVTVTGQGNYTGAITKNFTIAKATYDMSGAAWDYAGEFSYDATLKTMHVVGLPTGVTVAGYTGNAASAPGTYTAHATLGYDTANYNAPSIADLTWRIKASEGSVLEEIFNNLPASVEPDTGGGWKVTLTDDLAGPLALPDNLGVVTLDLNGHTMRGLDGADGDATTPGQDGQPTIRIVSDTAEGAATQLKIVTPGGTTALVAGGHGGSGVSGGAGAAAITVDNGARAGVTVDVGAGVTVQGGTGGAGTTGDGGDGGAGVDGNVGVNDGTIAGGAGGASDSGDGGNGGIGVTGDVTTNNGSISGGQGGQSETGADGSDGIAVAGSVGGGTGTVARVKIAPPVLANKEYTGGQVTADVPASTLYQVASNTGGTMPGSYPVVLVLVDSTRYEWVAAEGVNGSIVTLLFSIVNSSVPVSGGNATPSGGTAIAYSGTYDGLAHGISPSCPSFVRRVRRSSMRCLRPVPTMRRTRPSRMPSRRRCGMSCRQTAMSRRRTARR